MPEKRMAAVSIAFAIGILMAELTGWSGFALLVLGGLVLGMVFAPIRFRAAMLLLGLVMLAGAVRYGNDRSIAGDDVSRVAQHVTAFEGRVVSDAIRGKTAVRLTFRVTRAKIGDAWHKASGDVMLSVYNDRGRPMPRFAYGDRARIVARPYCPSEPTNPAQFSWRAYLARHGIYTCASVRDAAQVKMLGSSRGSGLMRLPLEAKAWLVSAIRRIHPSKEASVITGIILGSYAYIDDETLTDFTRTGTLHVMAASGYNCFVIVLLMMPVMVVVRIPAHFRSVIMVAIIAFYVLMAGPAPSLVRAGIMSALVLLAAPLRRTADYANLFYVAAFIVLLLNPSDLFDVGFQLSFLAVGSLVYVTPFIEEMLRNSALSKDEIHIGWNRRLSCIGGLIRRAWMWLRDVLASTAVATTAVGLVTGPVVAYYFHYVSLTSLPANLAVALVIPFIFIDSLLSPITSLLPNAPAYAGIVGTWATRAMLGVLDYFGDMRFSSISVRSPGILGIVGYYLVLYAAAGYVRSKLEKR